MMPVVKVEASETSLALAVLAASFIIVTEEPAVARTVVSQFVVGTGMDQVG